MQLTVLKLELINRQKLRLQVPLVDRMGGRHSFQFWCDDNCSYLYVLNNIREVLVHKGAVSLTRADPGTVAIVTSDGRMIVVSLNTSLPLLDDHPGSKSL